MQNYFEDTIDLESHVNKPKIGIPIQNTNKTFLLSNTNDSVPSYDNANLFDDPTFYRLFIERQNGSLDQERMDQLLNPNCMQTEHTCDMDGHRAG
jgi:hypothetical protein